MPRLILEKKEMLDEEFDSTPKSADSTVRYMKTLPDFLNDTVGKSLALGNDKPQKMIEVLGDFLGITDYERNMASFWFLDILALQVLRSNEYLDDYTRVIFISWLVGEMNLIRDKKFSREKFFDEMEILFTAMARKVARGGTIPHWNLISFDAIGIESEMQLEEQELSREPDLSASKDLEPKAPTKTKSTDEEIKSTLLESSTSINYKSLLDIIIKATYDMYAGEVRYSLVYAIFVEPIEIKVHNLPFTLRKPRPTKTVDVTYAENFNLKLRKVFKQMEQMSRRRSVTRKKKPTNVKTDPTKEYPPEPPNSLLEETLLLAKRSFILPLIESEEAVDLFDSYEEATGELGKINK